MTWFAKKNLHGFSRDKKVCHHDSPCREGLNQSIPTDTADVCRSITKIPVTNLRQCAAFHVFNSLQFLRQFLTLLPRNGLLFVFREFLDGRGVVPQIDLRADQ